MGSSTRRTNPINPSTFQSTTRYSQQDNLHCAFHANRRRQQPNNNNNQQQQRMLPSMTGNHRYVYSLHLHFLFVFLEYVCIFLQNTSGYYRKNKDVGGHSPTKHNGHQHLQKDAEQTLPFRTAFSMWMRHIWHRRAMQLDSAHSRKGRRAVGLLDMNGKMKMRERKRMRMNMNENNIARLCTSGFGWENEWRYDCFYYFKIRSSSDLHGLIDLWWYCLLEMIPCTGYLCQREVWPLLAKQKAVSSILTADLSIITTHDKYTQTQTHKN